LAFLTLLIPSNLLFSLLNCPILLQSSLVGEVTLFQEIFAWVGAGGTMASLEVLGDYLGPKAG
jgi:hypothetical protein